MIRSFRLLLASTLVLAAGCGTNTNGASDPNTDPNDEQPVVSAAANVTSGIAPLAVQFTGVAAGGDGALTYAWDFGDGEVSGDQNPSHSFANSGTFSAAFTATDVDGDFATATVTIAVGSATAPAITASADQTSGLAPLTVNFAATVVGGDAPIQIAWNFGDGETAAAASAMHVYSTPGNYGATVTATDATGDVASATVLVSVGSDAKPVVTINANPTSGSAPLAVAFTSSAVGGDAPLTYAWDFGDGATATTQNASHTYMAQNSYAAKLKVTDADGDEANATVTIVVNNAQNPTKPDLQLANFGAFASGLDDAYEPNDDAAVYLGDRGTTGILYTVADAYIDPVDVTFFIDVLNFGSALNTPFDVDFYKNSPSTPAASVLGDDYATVSNLGANGSKRMYFTVADPTPGQTSRAYVRLDTFNEIAESIEDNNLSSGLDVTAVGDQDWFSVYEIAGKTLTVGVDLLPADYDVELYDEYGALVKSSANSGTTAESMTYAVPVSGLYFVRVFGYNGARSSATPYRLKITVP